MKRALAGWGVLVAVLAGSGCHSLLYAPVLERPAIAKTSHYTIEAEATAEEARALADECERMLAAYLRVLPPDDPAAFDRALRARPFEFLSIRDEARFHETSQKHGAGQVDGFFCEQGEECVIGPGLATQEERETASGPLFPAKGVQAAVRARASDLHVLYHEGFHQYFARLGAQELPTWLAEGLAEWYARRAAREPGQRFAAERRRAERTEMRIAARDLARRPDVLEASPGLERVEVRDLGVSVASYRIYTLFVAFLAEGEDGRLAPRLARALAEAVRGHAPRIDLSGLFKNEEEVRAAFVRFAQGEGDAILVSDRRE